MSYANTIKEIKSYIDTLGKESEGYKPDSYFSIRDGYRHETYEAPQKKTSLIKTVVNICLNLPAEYHAEIYKHAANTALAKYNRRVLNGLPNKTTRTLYNLAAEVEHEIIDPKYISKNNVLGTPGGLALNHINGTQTHVLNTEDIEKTLSNSHEFNTGELTIKTHKDSPRQYLLSKSKDEKNAVLTSLCNNLKRNGFKIVGSDRVSQLKERITNRGAQSSHYKPRTSNGYSTDYHCDASFYKEDLISFVQRLCDNLPPQEQAELYKHAAKTPLAKYHVSLPNFLPSNTARTLYGLAAEATKKATVATETTEEKAVATDLAYAPYGQALPAEPAAGAGVSASGELPFAHTVAVVNYASDLAYAPYDQALPTAPAAGAGTDASGELPFTYTEAPTTPPAPARAPVPVASPLVFHNVEPTAPVLPSAPALPAESKVDSGPVAPYPGFTIPATSSVTSASSEESNLDTFTARLYADEVPTSTPFAVAPTAPAADRVLTLA